MTYPTSRRFPRSLAQAFPRDHACAIEHHRVSRIDRLAGLALAIFIGVALALTLVYGG